MAQDDNGWEASAAAWIAAMAERGDFAREHVIDAPLLARIRAGGFTRAIDIGCGEGRLCRAMQAMGIAATGVEPTPSLRRAAEARDPGGVYVDATAESLPFADGSFDLAISCLTLLDIDDIGAAIPEMARVLAPGGAALIVNLNSFHTAGSWQRRGDGTRAFVMDHYMEARLDWVSWNGITVRNWHRPFSHYTQPLLAAGLVLTHFDEPLATGGEPERVARYRRAPYFHIMEWRKPPLPPASPASA